MVDRLTDKERLGVLLAYLPKSVVEHYLETLTNEQASDVVQMLARYQDKSRPDCNPDEIGERFVQRVALDVLAHLSRDVPDLVAQLIFQPAPFPEVFPGTDQMLHILAWQNGHDDVDRVDHVLGSVPRTSS